MSQSAKASWWLSLAMFLLVVLMIGLGVWQYDRGKQKRAKLESFDSKTEFANLDPQRAAELSRYTWVTAQGSYLSDQQIIMDGMSANKQAGYMVLTPLKLSNSDQIVMVNRGWRPWRSQRNEINDIDVDDDLRTVKGRLDNFWQTGLVLGTGNQSESAEWPRLSVYPQAEEISEWLDMGIMTRQILLEPNEKDGFRRVWRPSGISPERHFGYSIQWFAMALALVILLLISYRNSQET